MSSALRSQVLSGYRSIYRARKVAFAGDTNTLLESRKALKVEFLKNATINDPEHLQELLLGVAEVADMLRTGVLQGQIVEDEEAKPRVQVKIRKDQGTKMEKDGITNIENLGGGDIGGKDEGKPLDDIVIDKGRKKK